MFFLRGIIKIVNPRLVFAGGKFPSQNPNLFQKSLFDDSQNQFSSNSRNLKVDVAGGSFWQYGGKAHKSVDGTLLQSFQNFPRLCLVVVSAHWPCHAFRALALSWSPRVGLDMFFAPWPCHSFRASLKPRTLISKTRTRKSLPAGGEFPTLGGWQGC